jgi:hypothetical protein
MPISNHLWQVDRDLLDSWAKKDFYQISGLHRESPGKAQMESHAAHSFETIKGLIKPQAVFSYFPEPSLEGGRLTLGNEWVYCQVLEQVDPERIRGALVYGLTIGDYPDDEDLFIRLMGDFWGTAYVDSARKSLREDMKAREEFKEFFFSDELGPGFFGMGMNNAWKFGKLIDLSEIGVQLGSKGMMTPQKSALGLYLISEDSPITFGDRCLYCKGNEGGCKLCMEEDFKGGI